jgi:hypothetical protein
MPRNAKSVSVFFLRKTARQAVVYGGADLVLATDCQDLREKELDECLLGRYRHHGTATYGDWRGMTQ